MVGTVVAHMFNIYTFDQNYFIISCYNGNCWLGNLCRFGVAVSGSWRVVGVWCVGRLVVGSRL